MKSHYREPNFLLPTRNYFVMLAGTLALAIILYRKMFYMLLQLHLSAMFCFLWVYASTPLKHLETLHIVY